MDHIEELARALAKLPGIGPRQGKRFVYYLLATPATERKKLSELISALGKDVKQCPDCMRYFNGSNANTCNYCSDKTRDDSLLMLVEKDQDLSAVERAGTYKGRYFVLGGVLTLSGKGTIREKELLKVVEKRLKNNLKELVLALSATSEGEHTTDRVRELLKHYRLPAMPAHAGQAGDHLKISELGRGLATGSELEYSDAETLRAALTNRKET
ncbi:recombination protein RecR [Candidatus Kaiserbacteria bacterium]|nr:recombination protein RecR [Candidatus Kaiserbacteria bacterium]